MLKNDLSIVSGLDELRHRQCVAWERGDRLLVEPLIAGLETQLTDSELLELIFAEVTLRAGRGEVCAADAYVQRFPQFAESLKRLFTKPDALESPDSQPSKVNKPPQVDRPQIKKMPRGSDRNLLFGILALQMDFISRDALIEALRDWTTQKERPLGQILVERGDLLASRRELMESLVEEHVRRHDNDPAVSLASISSVYEVSVDWHRVHDVDIAESLAVRGLSRSARPSEGASGSGHVSPVAGATRYRILRPHAEGGLGCVLVAYDEELHREVALKEIKPQFARDISSRNRFMLEAEVTGGLEHPGIVPVYGLGQYSDGRPYYAMRFIRGDSLKEAIEQFHAAPMTKPKTSGSASSGPAPKNQEYSTIIGNESQVAAASPRESASRLVSSEAFAGVEFRKLLGRFIDVCQAIEYAHSRGVLHRDLKPGNIMLGKYGETLVVDWGLAKIAGKEDRFANVDEATLVPSSGSSIEKTAFGWAIGTPGYMSPEQAAGNLEEIGPATDVYSLGATLYHILTGRAPFAKQNLAELLERVKVGAFPLPREINSKIPKTLEAVCLKAMALKSVERYVCSAAIAEDIEHWLADEPVNAYRETTISQAARWVRKHRTAAVSGAAAFVLVTVVSTVYGMLLNSAQGKVITAQQSEARQLQNALYNEKEAQRQLHLKEQETKRADEEAIRAKVSGELTSFMRELFTSSDPTGLTGSGLLPAGEGSRNVTAVELLDHGARLMREKFQSPSRSDQLTRAAMVSAIGDVSRSLGLFDQSKPLLLEALRIRQELLPADDKDLAMSRFQLANWHAERGDFQEAEKLYAEVLAGHHRRNTLDSVEAADVQLRMSAMLISIGDSRSEQYARDGLATRERILGVKHRETAIGRMVLAGSLLDQQKTLEAIALVVSAMESLTSTHGLGNEKILASVLEYQAGVILSRANFNSLAIPRFRRAVELMKQSLGPQHMYITVLLYDLGSSLWANKQLLDAENVYRECLDVVRATVGLEHPRAIVLLSSYCELLAELDRPDEGVNLINEALAASDQRYGKSLPWRLELISVGVTTAVNAKRFEMASALGEEALASLATREQPLSPDEGIDLANMAHKLGDLPDLTLCRKAYERVFALNQRQNDLEELWTDNLNFGGALSKHKFYLEAEPYLREAVRLSKTPEVRRINDFSPMAFTLLGLGNVDWAAGRFAEAEANFRAALVEDKKAGSKAELLDTLSQLINFLIVRQQFAEAAPLVDQYGRIADLSVENRAWHFYLQAALHETAGTPAAKKPVLEELEKAIGDSTVPNAAMYRARAVVVTNGDATRELARLNDLPQNDQDQEGILMARTACALHLEKLEVARETLDRMKSPLETDSQSQLRMLFRALAVFRQNATDPHRDDLTAAVERAEANLETSKNLTTPEISDYAISNQVELRWWCQHIRHGWKRDGK